MWPQANLASPLYPFILCGCLLFCFCLPVVTATSPHAHTHMWSMCVCVRSFVCSFQIKTNLNVNIYSKISPIALYIIHYAGFDLWKTIDLKNLSKCISIVDFVTKPSKCFSSSPAYFSSACAFIFWVIDLGMFQLNPPIIFRINQVFTIKHVKTQMRLFLDLVHMCVIVYLTFHCVSETAHLLC